MTVAVNAKRTSWQGNIYADTPLTAREIAADLAQTLHGSVTGAGATMISAERIKLDVTHRDEWPPSDPVNPEDAFLYFRHIIEFFTEDDFDREALVADLSAVLGALDRLGVRYVTAADFEDELPRGGRSTA